MALQITRHILSDSTNRSISGARFWQQLPGFHATLIRLIINAELLDNKLTEAYFSDLCNAAS